MELSEFQTTGESPRILNKDLLDEVMPLYTEFVHGNEYLQGLEHGKGSNPLINGAFYKVLVDNNIGLRPAVPTDNVYDKDGIFSLIEDYELYTHFNALDVFSNNTDHYKRNSQILEDVIALAQKRKGSNVTFPFRLQGFYVIPDKGKGGAYGVQIEPADNFRIIEDAKLHYSGQFNSLDEHGLVVPNENGRFTKFTNTRGLSAVGLNYDGYLFSGSGNIGDSGISGRVALVSDDAYIE